MVEPNPLKHIRQIGIIFPEVRVEKNEKDLKPPPRGLVQMSFLFQVIVSSIQEAARRLAQCDMNVNKK